MVVIATFYKPQLVTYFSRHITYNSNIYCYNIYGPLTNNLYYLQFQLRQRQTLH